MAEMGRAQDSAAPSTTPGAAVLGRVQGGVISKARCGFLWESTNQSKLGKRDGGWLILVGRGCSSAWRHSTWICCTMLRSWTRNSFASLALSDKPFSAWESWLCRANKEQGHLRAQDSSSPLDCVGFGLGVGCSPALPPASRRGVRVPLSARNNHHHGRPGFGKEIFHAHLLHGLPWVIRDKPHPLWVSQGASRSFPWICALQGTTKTPEGSDPRTGNTGQDTRVRLKITQTLLKVKVEQGFPAKY